MAKHLVSAWVVLVITFFLIFVTFNGTIQNPVNHRIDIIENLPMSRPTSIDSEVFNSSPNNPQGSTRSRYLVKEAKLDDPWVQLTVISEDGSDNYYGNIGAGEPIATGDINNDGFADMILGSPFADGYTENVASAGQVMVIFGKNQTYPNTIYDQAEKNPEEINLIIHGQRSGNYIGLAVACGDLDGDNYDDIIMGAPYGDGKNDGRTNAGEVYVFYGKPRNNFGTDINLQNTAPDLTIYGAQGGSWPNYDVSGYSLAVGNVIGDTHQDLIIGAPYVSRSGRTSCGGAFVVAGDTRANLGNEIDLSTSADVFILGDNTNDVAGYRVASGEINGDSYDDIIIGSIGYDPFSTRIAGGAVYAIYGAQSLNATYDLASDADVTVLGAASYDYLGQGLAVGNFNGDQYGDIIMGAYGGDGQNDALSACGDVYILYGSSTLITVYDTNSNDHDVVIYGRESGDYLGYSIATGNANNDAYDDIIIGALGGDGYLNSNADAGEAYLVLGNSTVNLGTNIDLSTRAESMFYGIDDDDLAGRYVQMGDLDGDSNDDIIIFSAYADGPNNARDYAGEFYLVYSAPPPIKNEFLKLVDGTNDNKTIFARYKEYTFRINVSNILGFNDVKSVTLIIDPTGYNIRYNWTRITKEFNRVYDPNNLLTLNATSSTATRDGNHNYLIDFRLRFNWNFSKNGLIDCKLKTRGIRSLTDEDIYPGLIRVNNKLTFKGDLKVTGEFQGALSDNAWVRGEEKLTFSGLTVVYNGTTNNYPPLSSYSLGIEDSFGITKIPKPNLGKQLDASINALDLTYDNPYYIRIFDVGEDTDVSSESIQLKIDADVPDPPDYVNCKADSFSELESALVDNDREIYLDWEDVIDIGSGTIGYYYSFEDLNGTDSGNWVELNSVKIPNFAEGLNTIYVWAKDAVGNIGEANYNQIFVDLTEPIFENFTPTQDQWFNSAVVDCGIQIYDQNGFGIDLDSIEFWNAYTESWLPVNTSSGEQKPTQLNVQVQVKFKEGIESYTQFRVSDLAGNGPTESDKYYFKIDTTTVNFTEPKPEPKTKQGEQNVKCQIIVQDLGGSGVDLSSIQYSYTTSGLPNFTDWTDADLAMAGKQFGAEESSKWFVELKFKRGAENYIRWRAKDIAGNGYTVSENYSVLINALPTIIVKELDPGQKIDTKTDIILDGEATFDVDNDVEDLYFYWSSNISSHLGNEKIITTKLPAGHHEITLRVFDGINTASYSFNLTVDQAPKKVTVDSGISTLTKGSNLWILILIIIIIIMALIFMILFSKETKKRQILEKKLISASQPTVSRYQPAMSAQRPPLELQRIPTPVAEPFPVTDKPYEVTAKPEIKQLPSAYGTSASAQQPSVDPWVGATPTVISGEPGQQVPQLPPAQPTIQAPPSQPEAASIPEQAQGQSQPTAPELLEPIEEQPEILGLTPDSPEFQKKMKEGENN